MANVRALHSVGGSIATFLRSTYPATLNGQPMPACQFVSMACGELAGVLPDDPQVALLLYRVTVSEHGRRPQAGVSPQAMALDLHYLLTAFASTAEDEQVPLAWAMRQLHLHPLLDASSLSPDAGWQRDEVVQIVPQELAVDELVRIWEALEPSYRLSASYVARMVRLDPDSDDSSAGPVLARRLAYGQASQASEGGAR